MTMKLKKTLQMIMSRATTRTGLSRVLLIGTMMHTAVSIELAPTSILQAIQSFWRMSMPRADRFILPAAFPASVPAGFTVLMARAILL